MNRLQINKKSEINYSSWLFSYLSVTFGASVVTSDFSNIKKPKKYYANLNNKILIKISKI